MKTVTLAYDRNGMQLEVPDSTIELEGSDAPALPLPAAAIREALASPTDSPPLLELLEEKRPRTVAITVSDYTRPVPSHLFLPVLLDTINSAGIPDSAVTVIIGTGMHRPSTAAEIRRMVGERITRRIEVVNHDPRRPETLLSVSSEPPVRICRRFAEADFRIATGFIEPHFMAGFSGGRKAVCPALVDLDTISRFHGYETLASPLAVTGSIAGNPCHEIALDIARKVGVDFLLNVTVTRGGGISGVFCGDLEAAHMEGCRRAAEHASAGIDDPFDLVITSGGGFPLDTTFYQAVKGMVGALPAVHGKTSLLLVAGCAEGTGSKDFMEIMLKYSEPGGWRKFLDEISATEKVRRDQWQFQMQCRMLERTGPKNIRLATDGIDFELQHRLSLEPLVGEGDARARAQGFINEYIEENPDARVAVIPAGPYTMIVNRKSQS